MSVSHDQVPVTDEPAEPGRLVTEPADSRLAPKVGFFRRIAPTMYFIGRRLAESVVVLIGATFIVYMLLSVAIDPLEDLYGSSAPNKAQLIEARMRALDLYTPAPIRYVKWLGGAAGCLIGQCDLGSSYITNQPVLKLLGTAIPSTLQLITTSTIVAILLGITVGIVSALRQYTGFDYAITFLSFVLYSLPSFWVAVLLKQWGAIGFNNFLRDPTISLPMILLLSAVAAIIWQAVIAGDARRRLIVAAGVFVSTVATLWFISDTKWLLDPKLGPVVVGVTGVGAAFVITAISAGLRNRRALYSALTTAAVGTALYFPLQGFFAGDVNTPLMLALLLTAVLGGVLIGYLYGGPDKGQSMRAAALTAVVVAFITYFDRVMQVWRAYSNSSYIKNRPIATIGSQTPNLQGSYWAHILDLGTHLILPTMTLILISFATYTRYSRASLLEVMNQDYIRTARAKGLSERVVIMRHAFRNALIPLATIIPLDFAALFGGAIITERVFAWAGMGTLFYRSLQSADAEPLMGYFIVVATLLVLANVVVDFVYAALDPRIRVNA